MTDFVIAHLGQSNKSGWWENSSATPPSPASGTYVWSGSSWVAPSGDGMVEFSNRMKNTGHDIYNYKGAIGGSALCKVSTETSSPEFYWLSQDSTSPLTSFLDMVTAAGKIPDIILWDQGERDTKRTSEAEYCCGMVKLHEILKAAWDKTTLPFFISMLGKNSLGSPTTDSSTTAIRRAQQLLVDYVPDFHLANTSLDLATFDGLHRTPEANGTEARRAAASICNFLNPAGGIKSAFGPRIVGVTQSGDYITLTFEGNSTAYGAGLWAISGLQVSDNDFTSLIPVSDLTTDVTYPSANQIKFKLTASPSGLVKIRYLYGKSPLVPIYGNFTPFGDLWGGQPAVPGEITAHY